MTGAGLVRARLPADPDAWRLAQASVQVWVLHDADVQAVCSALAHTLSPDERARARTYRQAPHRQRFIARRGMLRWLSARYLGCTAQSLRFGCEELGKPALQRPLLQRPAAPRLAFSVSQTGSMALLAFAWDCSIGVDVEQLTDGVDMAGVGREVFSLIEENALAGAGRDAAAAFFRIWTRKEALLKAVGTGLSRHAKAYATQDDRQGGAQRWQASHNGAALTGWTFLDLALSPQVKAALAVSRRDAQVWLRPCPLPFLLA